MGVQLQTTTDEHLSLIKSWMAADPWHSVEKRNSAEWLLTGGGLLSFNVVDDKGILCFCRLDAEGDLARVAIQFAPESEVSKRRLIVGLMKAAFPGMEKFLRQKGFKGAVFESINGPLIDFLTSVKGFSKAANDDYVMVFGA